MKIAKTKHLEPRRFIVPKFIYQLCKQKGYRLDTGLDLALVMSKYYAGNKDKIILN